MKNKNLLAENMLRFKAKNLSETTKRKIVKLAEIISEQEMTPGDVEQGKKLLWNIGYRKGNVLENPFPRSPKGELGNFEMISSTLFVKPSDTPGERPNLEGRVELKHTKTGEQVQLVISGGNVPRINIIGKDPYLKQIATAFNNKQSPIKDNEFLNTIKSNYMSRV